MKKQRKPVRLGVKKETVRNLSQKEMAQAAGGAVVTVPSKTNSGEGHCSGIFG
jgi:hypothetical protein